MTDMARLYDLQKIDSHWEKMRRRLIQLQKLLADPEEVVAARTATETLDESLRSWQGKQKDAELAAQALAQRITSTEQKLMSGSVRDPKELQALQSSGEALRRQREGVEESAVEALLQVEDLTAQRHAQAGRLETLETAWRTRHADLVAEEAKLRRQALQLKAQRAKITEALPAADLALYEDLRKRKAGIAVASVENGQCSACNMRVPTGVATNAKGRTQEIYCTSCGRLLCA